MTQWKLQQDVICDVEIVVTAIEQAYGKRFPVHLCLSSLSRADSNPAKMFFGNDVHRLRLKDGQAVYDAGEHNCLVMFFNHRSLIRQPT